MRVLVVFAHPEPKSLNGALKDLAVKTLKENGHEVKVSDLYGIGFKATLDQNDFLKMQNSERFYPMTEQLSAVQTNSLVSDIKAEMGKIEWADLIIFQFPIWYGTVPAILKGWFDRVFANGFAHKIFEEKIYDNGLLKGKKGMLSFTAGGSAENFYKDIEGEDKTKLLPQVAGILEFVGLEVLKPFTIFEAVLLSEQDVKKHFEVFKKVLREL